MPSTQISQVRTGLIVLCFLSSAQPTFSESHYSCALTMYPELSSHSQIQATPGISQLLPHLGLVALRLPADLSELQMHQSIHTFLCGALLVLLTVKTKGLLCWHVLKHPACAFSHVQLFPASQSTGLKSEGPPGHQDLDSVLYPDYFPRAIVRTALNSALSAPLCHIDTHLSIFPLLCIHPYCPHP